MLRVHAKECKEQKQQQQQPPAIPTPNDDILKKITGLETELNYIQQYLRENNLEIVGLPEPNNAESNEKLLLYALNELEGLENVVTPDDIDISHPLKIPIVKMESRYTSYVS